jgi:hypothetical protein
MNLRLFCFGLLAALAAVTNAATAADEPAGKTKKKSKPAAAAKELNPFDRPEGSIVDQTARYYVWYDKQGWHVRTTAKGGRNFHGTIRVKEAKIKSCVPIGLKDGKQRGVTDAVKFNEARTELKFAFKTGKMSDGFDLAVDGEAGQIEFELAIDNQKNPKWIFVGRALGHPAENPFSLPTMPKREK